MRLPELEVTVGEIGQYVFEFNVQVTKLLSTFQPAVHKMIRKASCASPYFYQIDKPFEKEKLLRLVETQLKLGKTNQRLDVNVLNSFVGNLIDFQRNRLKVACEMKKPVSKNMGEDVSGSIYKSVEVAMGNSRSLLVFSATKDFLHQSGQLLFGEEKSTSPLMVLEVMGRHILESSVKALSNQVNVKFLKTRIFESTDLAEVQKIMAMKGLQIETVSELGNFNLYSLW